MKKAEIRDYKLLYPPEFSGFDDI